MTALVCGVAVAAVHALWHVAYQAGYRTALGDVRQAAERRTTSPHTGGDTR